jgi:hypothetical protein
MSKSKGVIGTPVNHVGPSGALIGNREGFTPGTPQGTKSTVLPQYRGGGINTQPNEVGTPLQDVDGNPDEFSRTAEGTGRYGKVISENGQDHADPASNGRGVMLDVGPLAGGSVPPVASTLDGPAGGPKFEPGSIISEDRAHLGRGNDSAVDGLVEGGGVMSK